MSLSLLRSHLEEVGNKTSKPAMITDRLHFRCMHTFVLHKNVALDYHGFPTSHADDPADMTAPTAASDAETLPAPAATALPPRASSALESTMQQHHHDAPREEGRSERALRVSQLDADEMDSGLIHMLNAKISRALGVFGVSSLRRCVLVFSR